jgi:Uma2 family endonuclease
MGYALLKPLSEQAYLALEDTSVTKNEFVGGVIHAMSGASAAHNVIALNLASACLGASGKGSCQPFMGDMRLRLDDGHTYYYPDVMVACQPEDNAAMFRSQPCMLAEVLSPSTASIDRREKLIAYKQLPSLREYLIIAQDQMRVEHHLRLSDAVNNERGNDPNNKHSNNSNWGLRILGSGDSLELLCLPLILSIDELYARVVFTPSHG